MIFYFFFIGLIIQDFGKKTFNSTTDPSSFQLPYIIFPHFLYQSKQLRIFNDFQKSIKDDPEIATAQIDCLTSRTACSKLMLQPGFIHISYPPHKPKVDIKKLNRPIISADSLTKVYNKIINGNVQTFKNCLIENIYGNMTDNSSETIYPAFVLASKLQNLDDLDEKLSVFKQVALEYIYTDILFAYVTEPSIYDTFNISPRTEIIYISPSHKNIIFNSGGSNSDHFQFQAEDSKLSSYYSSSSADFTVDDLKQFVEIHKIPFLADPNQYHLDNSKGIFLTVVNNNQFLEEKEIIDQLKNIHTQLPVVFIDNSKNPFLASSVCRDFNNFNSIFKSKSDTKSVSSHASCLALVDFVGSKSIVLNQTIQNNFDLNEIIETVDNFTNIYNEHTTFSQKIYQKFMFELEFNQHTIIAFVAAAFSVLVVLLGMIFSCKSTKRKKQNDNFVFPPVEKDKRKEKDNNKDQNQTNEKEKKD